jgi:hypothetical protein
MVLLPTPHSRGVLRVTEVVAVLGLLQPPALTDRFALALALGSGAVLLPPPVAHVGRENLSAEQALLVALVRHASPPDEDALCSPCPAPLTAGSGPSAGGNGAKKTIEIWGAGKKTDGTKPRRSVRPIYTEINSPLTTWSVTALARIPPVRSRFSEIRLWDDHSSEKVSQATFGDPVRLTGRSNVRARRVH